MIQSIRVKSGTMNNIIVRVSVQFTTMLSVVMLIVVAPLKRVRLQRMKAFNYSPYLQQLEGMAIREPLKKDLRTTLEKL